jgi:hypothetical protein
MAAIAAELRHTPVASVSAFLTLILTVVLIVLALRDSPESKSPVTVEQAIDNYYAAETVKPASTPPRSARPHRAQKKIGRNETCPCGSGRKHKKCRGMQP